MLPPSQNGSVTDDADNTLTRHHLTHPRELNDAVSRGAAVYSDRIDGERIRILEDDARLYHMNRTRRTGPEPLGISRETENIKHSLN